MENWNLANHAAFNSKIGLKCAVDWLALRLYSICWELNWFLNCLGNTSKEMHHPMSTRESKLSHFYNYYKVPCPTRCWKQKPSPAFPLGWSEPMWLKNCFLWLAGIHGYEEGTNRTLSPHPPSRARSSEQTTIVVPAIGRITINTSPEEPFLILQCLYLLIIYTDCQILKGLSCFTR